MTFFVAMVVRDSMNDNQRQDSNNNLVATRISLTPDKVNDLKRIANIFNSMTTMMIVEHIDIDKASALVAGKKLIDKELDCESIENTWADQLKDLLLRVSPDGTMVSSWSPMLLSYKAGSKKRRVYGRNFCNGPTLCNLKREIRAIIASGLYEDFDMVNAHPVILLDVCDKYGIACDILRKYVSNREEMLASTKLDRRSAKKLFLKIINGGKVSSDAELLYKDFYVECKHIRHCLAYDPVILDPIVLDARVVTYNLNCKKKSDYIQELPKSNNKWIEALTPYPGRADIHKIASVVMNSYEKKILMTLYAYMNDCGYDVTRMVPCYDGVLIPTEYNGMAHLPNINAVIARTGSNVRFINKKMAVNENIFKTMLANITRQVVVQKYVGDMKQYIDSDKCTVLIKSPMGSGKTTQIVKYINNECSNKKVLFVTFRKSLSNTTYKLVKHCVHYKKVSGKLALLNGAPVVVQVESLGRIDGTPDVTILDEFTYSLHHLCSRVRKEADNKHKLAVALRYLEACVVNSGVLIVADAILPNILERAIHKARPFKVTSINSVAKPYTGKQIKVSKKKIFAMIEDDWREGRMLAISCTIKTVAMALKDLADDVGVNVLVMTADINTEYTCKTELWDSYEGGVIYTPVITAGVSCDSKKFYRKYGLFSSNSSGPRASVQLLGRVRHPICPDIYFHISDYNPVPVYGEKVNVLRMSRKTMREGAAFSNIASVLSGVSLNTNTMNIDTYQGLALMSYAVDRVCCNTIFTQSFVQALCSQGFALDVVTSIKAKVYELLDGHKVIGLRDVLVAMKELSIEVDEGCIDSKEKRRSYDRLIKADNSDKNILKVIDKLTLSSAMRVTIARSFTDCIEYLVESRDYCHARTAMANYLAKAHSSYELGEFVAGGGNNAPIYDLSDESERVKVSGFAAFFNYVRLHCPDILTEDIDDPINNTFPSDGVPSDKDTDSLDELDVLIKADRVYRTFSSDKELLAELIDTYKVGELRVLTAADGQQMYPSDLASTEYLCKLIKTREICKMCDQNKLDEFNKKYARTYLNDLGESVKENLKDEKNKVKTAIRESSAIVVSVIHMYSSLEPHATTRNIQHLFKTGSLFKWQQAGDYTGIIRFLLYGGDNKFARILMCDRRKMLLAGLVVCSMIVNAHRGANMSLRSVQRAVHNDGGLLRNILEIDKENLDMRTLYHLFLMYLGVRLKGNKVSMWLETETLKCIYKGHQTSGLYKDLRDFNKEVLACPNAACKLQYMRMDMYQHSHYCEKKTWVCSICNKEGLYEDKERHYIACWRKKLVTCKVCGLVQSRSRYKRHCAKCGGYCSCIHCRERVLTSEIDKHLASCTSNPRRMVICNVCSSMVSSALIDDHVPKCKLKREEARKCKFCKRAYKNLERHIGCCRKNPDAKWKCPWCKESLESSNKARHKKRCHRRAFYEKPNDNALLKYLPNT